MKLALDPIRSLVFSAISLLALVACGGGSSLPPFGETGSPGADYGGPASGPNYHTVGGTVTGLAGQGLRIELLNLANLSHHTTVLEQIDLGSDGVFVFSTPPSQEYGVAIVNQPHSPAQRCVVSNDRGEIGAANVTDVGVVCGEFLYATYATAGTVSAFAVEAASGALASSGTPVYAEQLPYAIISTPDKKHLYVGNGASNDISLFAVEPSNGKLTNLNARFGAGTNPRGLALYSAVTQGYGSAPTVEWYLYTANTDSNNLWVYHIDKSSGALTHLRPADTGVGPSALLIDPSAPFLYVSNAGGSSDISAFRIDNYSGLLTQLDASPFPSGSNVSSMAFGTNGAFLYAADATGSAASIYGFSVDPEAGTLTKLTGFPYGLPSCSFIVSDHTGSHLYAVSGTNLLGYSIDAQSGVLTLLPDFPVIVGVNANFMTIDPTNQFLYVRDGNARALRGFLLDGATGEVTSIPGSPFDVGALQGSVAAF